MIEEPLRVLLFNTAFRWVGEAGSTDLLARTLKRRGHEVGVVVPEGGPVHEHSAGAPYRVHPVPWPNFKDSPRPVARALAVARLLHDTSPQVLHVGRGSEHWLAAFLRLAGATDAAIVRTRHVVLPMRQSLANRCLFTWGTDAVTAVSSATFHGLGNLPRHFPSDRCRIIPGAVDTQRFSPAHRSQPLREAWGAEATTPVVGCIGRFQPVKAHDVFLKAMGLVAREIPTLRVVLSGRKVTNGDTRLRRWCDEAGIADRVHLAGEQDDIAALIASLDIGVIASRASEGFSRIAVEYLASGVPIVSTTVGALPEILSHESTGLLVEPEDAPAIAGATLRLLHDRELRDKFREEGLRVVGERYLVDHLASAMEAVYRTAIHARSQCS